MFNFDNENGTQFVYHNFFEDNGALLAATVSQITEEGLWCPVAYSILTPDIFFYGGGLPGAITVICATPHERSDEDVGVRHTWKKVKAYGTTWKIYTQDDAIPAHVRRFLLNSQTPIT